MLASNKNRKGFQYTLFICWILGTLIAAVYFVNARLVPFDPNKTLLNVDSHELLAKIKDTELLKGYNLKNTLVHITSSNCDCSSYSNEHKISINKQAAIDGFNVLDINIATNVKEVFPSTPAALITDEEGQLIYFGPYSEGLACASSNGLIELVMNNYKKGFNSRLIFSESKGCYCNV